MTIIILPTKGCPYNLCCNNTGYIDHNKYKLTKWSLPFEVSPSLRRLYFTWDSVGKIVDIWRQSLRKEGFHPNIEIFVDNDETIPINVATFGSYLNMIIQEPTGILVPDLRRVAPTPHGNITISISDEEYNTIVPKRSSHERLVPYTSINDNDGYTHTDRYNYKYIEIGKGDQYTYDPPRPILNKYTQRRVEPYYKDNTTSINCYCTECLQKNMPFTMANL